MHSNLKSLLGGALFFGVLAFAAIYGLILLNDFNTFWKGVRSDVEHPTDGSTPAWLEELEANQERIDEAMRQNQEDTQELFRSLNEPYDVD